MWNENKKNREPTKQMQTALLLLCVPGSIAHLLSQKDFLQKQITFKLNEWIKLELKVEKRESIWKQIERTDTSKTKNRKQSAMKMESEIMRK